MSNRSGQYETFLFNGKRNEIIIGLPLSVETTITGQTWKAIVNIPMDYLPMRVKFKFKILNVLPNCN